MNHPNWKYAEELLQLIVPSAPGFDLDHEAWIPVSSWIPCSMDDLLGDTACLRRLELVTGAQLGGRLVVVTFSSWAGNWGPYFLDYANIEEFFDAHVEWADDCVFTGGDAFVLSPETQTILIHSHHDMAVAISTRDA